MHTNNFGIHNKSIFEFMYRECYIEKINKTTKELDGGNSSSKTVAAAGKKTQIIMSKDLHQTLTNLSNDLKK